MASITLAQGGALAQHVSSANVYLGGSGPVFPADVQASNYAAVQIAIIYDTDGSVTDTLLGSGASAPTSCRQNAVTESVDSIATSGQIQHALLILNGRCTGSGTAPQQEMKYRLVRAFGRILGLGWSQLNDNVFTGSPQATTQQAQNWPVMHPIDILCGTYAYQCMVNPFTLRPDDLASLITLYPVSTTANGKTASYTNAAKVDGFVNFANGQGMQGVLVSLRRFHFGPGYSDAFDLVSGVTGYNFQTVASNPMTPKGTTLAASVGSSNTYYEGHYYLGWVPVPSTDYFDNFTVTTSAINPLYTGQYAVGSYALSQVVPSGPPMTNTAYVVSTLYGAQINMTATGVSAQGYAASPATCGGTADGTESVPLPVASSGFWSGALCGYQHGAWSSLAVKAGRSLTMEVTAVDESGYATTGKLLPVMGAWASTDVTGTLPTLASQAAALNATTLGMTNMRASTSAAGTLRLALADQRGDGRPDYAYNARILYADAVSPASLPANGGAVTLSGIGFRNGNTVTVNGIAANVTGWTANSITLVAPPITGPLNADIVVTDLSTGGQSTMTGALTYSATSQPDVLAVVTKPASGGYVGSAGSPAFKVQVFLPDGVTPAASVATTLSSSSATFAACGNAATCTLTTDASGFVSSIVTPTAAGTVTLTATVGTSSVSTTFLALAVPVDTLNVLSLPSGTVYATLPAVTPFTVQVILPDGTTVAAGAQVVVSAGNAALAACSGLSTCTLTADSSGKISTTVTPLAAGTVSLLATAGGGTVSASFGATALPADMLHLVTRPADGSYVGRSATLPFAVQVLLGDNATPASGASVTLTAVNATLACGGSTCTVAANTLGNISTAATPTAAGTVTLTASAGGGTLSTTFTAAAVPPDTLTVVTKPANGSYAGRAAAIPFAVQTNQGDGSGPASGVSVTLTALNATLGCGASTCTLTANSTGTVSIAVTPTAVGTVTLTASAGGGTVSTTFTAAAVPPDTLTVVTKPANGSYAGAPAPLSFSVSVLLGDTGGPAAGTTVTVSATNAILGCGASSCTLAASSLGTVSTSVTPTAPGTVTLTANAGGGTVSTSFTAAAIPPDVLLIVTAPANNTLVGSPATLPLALTVLLGDGITPAANASVTITATNATLGACGLATCTLPASALGAVSTAVTAAAPGLVTLTASAGGGTLSTTFTAIAIPDLITVLSLPSGIAYVGRVAATPFSVQVSLGNALNPQAARTVHALAAGTLTALTGRPPDAGAPVTMTAVGGTLGACALPTCVVTADSNGVATTTVTPTLPGPVTLVAAAGGATFSSSFSATTPPDVVAITSTPANGSYANRTAAVPFTTQVFLGDGTTPAAGVSVTLTASNATLTACGQTTCTLTANAAGQVSTQVTPAAPGTVALSASAGGGSALSSFTAAAVPPDTLHVVIQPANGSYVQRTAATPFKVQALLGDTGGPATGAPVTLTASGATFTVCGLSACTLTADSAGSVATTVTPLVTGSIQLSASAGGGTVSTTFTAAPVPPDTLTVLTRPPDGSYVGTPSPVRFAVQTILGDTGGPAAGASVTVAATNAILGACNQTACTLTADASGDISTAVTPVAAGRVTLTATAGGGTVSASFTALPDTLNITSQPSGAVYAAVPAAAPFTVQVLLPGGTLPAAGTAVTLIATHATLTACAATTCTLTAGVNGTVSTTLTPQQPGLITLQAAAGGGTVSTSFTALALPPDILTITSAPAAPVYVKVPAAAPFAVHVLLGDNLTPAAAASVILTATGATFAACASSSCTLIADANGNLSTTVTPTVSGSVTLSASAGGTPVTTTFQVTPDTLQTLTVPANGTYTGSPAILPFAVQVLLGDGLTPAPGTTATVTVTNATLGACGLATCTLTADSTGKLSTTVTAATPGAVALTATAAGGTVSATFTATAPPAILTVLSTPANGSYTGRSSAVPFTVQVTAGTALNHLTATAPTPIPGALVTLTANGATLDACALPTCTLTADALGTVSTAVTPTGVGTITLSASANGGSASTNFNAVPVPDVLHITSIPADGTYFGRIAAAPYTVQVFTGDGITPAAGIAVTLTASAATLGACGQPTCILTANAGGIVSTTVTPTAPGAIAVSASAGGGIASATFTAATPPDILQVTSVPADGSYTGRPAPILFAVKVLLGDGITPHAAATVTFTATNALFPCGQSTCTATADTNGLVALAVSPLAAGSVTLTATSANGTATAAFLAVDPIRTIAIARATEFIAANATASWTATVAILENGLPLANVPITWTATAPGLSPATQTSLTDPTGTATQPLTLGPLAVGATTSGQACAWTTVCVSFTAQATDPSTWRIVALSGDSQTVASTATLQPVLLRAVDTAGDWIAGVPVQVYQTVRAWVACPPSGRCPTAPILNTSTAILTSDGDGQITLTPLQVTNTAETTGIVTAAGSNGYLSLSLSKTP